MGLKTLLLAVTLLLTVNLFAKKIPGTIVVVGQSQEVRLNIPFKMFGSFNYQRLQRRVTYYTASRENILTAEDADEISFTFKNKEVRLISVKNTLGEFTVFNYSSRIFLKLVVDGPLQLFEYQLTTNTAGMMSMNGMMNSTTPFPSNRIVLRKNGGELIMPGSLSFRKEMAEYLSNCPEVVKFIQERELRKGDLETIAMFYNKNCR